MESFSTAHMKRGLVWFAGGCAFTLFTYSLVAANGGGFYLVASGAIFFGLLQFVYGLILFGIEQHHNHQLKQLRTAFLAQAQGSRAAVELAEAGTPTKGEAIFSTERQVERTQPTQSAVSKATDGANANSVDAGEPGKIYQDFLRDLERLAKPPLSVGSNDWECDGNVVRRSYYIGGAAHRGARTTLEIVCSLEVDVSIHAILHFRLHPFHLMRQQVLPVWVGTHNRQLGHNVELLVTSPRYREAELRPISRKDAGRCIRVLSSGEDIVLDVLKDDARLFTVPLRNDASFSTLYTAVYDELAKQQLNKKALRAESPKARPSAGRKRTRS